MPHGRMSGSRLAENQKAATKGRIVMQRVAVLALTLALTAIAAMAQSRANDFPSRPLRLMIGFPPGSPPTSPPVWWVTP